MIKGIFISISIVFCILCFGCGDKADVQVTVSVPQATDSNYTVVRSNANLLKYRPKSMMDKPAAIKMLNQGDQITVLDSEDNWYHVQHVLSGQTGWLNDSFIQVETRSKWWSGDTDKARRVAEKIYKDKIFMERNWPVIHVNIEERWNKLVFTVKQDVDFPKDQAVECASFVMETLLEQFPSWRDHQVFLDSQWKDKEYSLVMNDDFEATFF